MRRKPDLIVPIRDRRQRKRFVTLKNFRNASIAFVIVFAAVHIRSEMRGTGADFGGLMQRTLPTNDGAQKPVEVVHEAAATSVPDATHPDPLLVEPMVRGQWLDPAYANPQATETVTPATFPTARAEAAVASGDTRVAIVGSDLEGVKVVQQERRRPVLSGGFGRR